MKTLLDKRAELDYLQKMLHANLHHSESDLQLLLSTFEQCSVFELAEHLPLEQQVVFLQEQYVWLDKAIAAIQAERVNVIAALDKIRFAKRAASSYHDVQKG